jgi:hypothetical protein
MIGTITAITISGSVQGASSTGVSFLIPGWPSR